MLPNDNALAVGTGNTVREQSLGVGENNYAWFGSIAAGWGNSASGRGLAVGNFASADGAVAFGEFCFAHDMSLASGSYCSAGYFSLASGQLAVAGAEYSTSIGISTTAQSYNSFVIGRYNHTDESYNPIDWVATEPLFVVGNGTGIANDPSEKRDAFVIYKNGKIKMQVAQGDISMGNFAQ